MTLDTTSQRWNNWVRVIMARQLRAQPSGKPLRDRTPGEKLPWTTKCRTNPLSAPAHATRVPWSTPNNLAAVSAGYLGKMLKAFHNIGREPANITGSFVGLFDLFPDIPPNHGCSTTSGISAQQRVHSRTEKT